MRSSVQFGPETWVGANARTRSPTDAGTQAAAHYLSAGRFGLQSPEGVLTWGSSIHGLLWWSNPLALPRHPRTQDIAGP